MGREEEEEEEEAVFISVVKGGGGGGGGLRTLMTWCFPENLRGPLCLFSGAY